MIKEFVLVPVYIGGCKGFIIPKRQYKLIMGRQYRVKVEEVWEQ